MKKLTMLTTLGLVVLSASCAKKKTESRSTTVTLYAAPAIGTWEGNAAQVQKSGAPTSCKLNYKLEQKNNRLDLFEMHVRCADGQNWVAPAQDWWMVAAADVPASVENTYGTIPAGAYALVESSGLSRAKVRGWTTTNGHELSLKTPTFDLEMKSKFLEEGQTPQSDVSVFKIYTSGRDWLTVTGGMTLTRKSKEIDRKAFSAYSLAGTELSATESKDATKLLCQNTLQFNDRSPEFSKIDFEGSNFEQAYVRVRSALRSNGFDRIALVEQGTSQYNVDKEKGVYRLSASLKDPSGYTHRVIVQTTNFITARLQWRQDGSDFSEESLCYFLQQ